MTTKTAALALTLLPTLAGASWDGLAPSLHFYSLGSGWGGKSPIDFGRLPQPTMYPGWNNEVARYGSEYGCSLGNGWDCYNGTTDTQYQIARAHHFEAHGEYRRAINAYLEAAKIAKSGGLSNLTESECQERVELFRACGFQEVKGLRPYLRAKFLLSYDEKGTRKKGLESLHTIDPAPVLKPYVAFTLADQEGGAPGPELANRYLSIYRQYPKSPRAEAALMMAIRSLLGERKKGRPSGPEVAEAKNLIAQLQAKYPKTRFRQNLVGWLGRCAFLQNDFRKATAYYVRQTTGSADAVQRWRAYDSLAAICRLEKRPDRLVAVTLRQRNVSEDANLRAGSSKALRDTFATLTPSQAQEVQRTIRRDPQLLESYLAFRIEDTRLSPLQERNLLAFATTSLDRLPSSPPALVVRTAQLNYNVGRYASARRLALRVAAKRSPKEQRCQAEYILAATDARQGRYQRAMAGYEAIVRQNPPTYLGASAQEHLALLNERHGNPEKAIAIYEKLGYEKDVAYLADARLTPAQLSHHISTLSTGAAKNILTYTLGMRYLRVERYALARRTFQRLPRTIRTNWGLSVAARKALEGEDQTLGFEKAPKVRDPLEVVDKLAHLTTLSRTAKTKARRAKALYDKVAYIYREHNLLFYSPALWKGERSFMIDIFWTNEVNDRSDEKALAHHNHEHECFAQCIRLCEEILRRYPKSAVVPKTLYTEAIAAEHLAHFNSWWRAHDLNLWRIAVDRATRLVHQFPHDPLAKSAEKYAAEFKGEAKSDYESR